MYKVIVTNVLSGRYSVPVYSVSHRHSHPGWPLFYHVNVEIRYLLKVASSIEVIVLITFHSTRYLERYVAHQLKGTGNKHVRTFL